MQPNRVTFYSLAVLLSAEGLVLRLAYSDWLMHKGGLMRRRSGLRRAGLFLALGVLALGVAGCGASYRYAYPQRDKTAFTHQCDADARNGGAVKSASECQCVLDYLMNHQPLPAGGVLGDNKPVRWLDAIGAGIKSCRSHV
jgi:hypothetical protein